MIAAALLLPLAIFANSGNLLANPGFEAAAGAQPERWDSFVAPQEGAFARLAGDAFAGLHCVLLHTPLPYPRDPANNWSQNVLQDLSGRRLRVAASIRTQDATQAAVWVQCWRRQPLGVLRVASTSDASPVSGTRGWERVQAEIEVPEGTAFLTVRCVLFGTGSAWFDEVELVDITDAGAPAPAAAPSVPVSAAPPAPAGAALGQIGDIERDLAQLRESNIELSDTLEYVLNLNTELMDQLIQLQDTLKTLQKAGAGEAPSPAAPPLVPHGEDWSAPR